MTISDLTGLVEGSLVQPTISEDRITGAYTSDLLSDVMANAAEGDVLITIQAHKNAVAVSGLAGIRAIVFCNNRPIPDDVTQTAEDEGIAIVSTALNQFVCSGRVYQALAASGGGPAGGGSAGAAVAGAGVGENEAGGESGGGSGTRGASGNAAAPPDAAPEA